MRIFAALGLTAALFALAACDSADSAKDTDDSSNASLEHARDASSAGAPSAPGSSGNGTGSTSGGTGTGAGAPPPAAADASAPAPVGACNLACVRGKHCVVSASGPRCVDDAPSPADAGSTTTGACAAALCPADTYCDDITGTAKCVPSPSCATVKCAAGTSCELVAVQCIRAPCPAQPQCVPSTPRVCNILCVQGTHCVVTDAGPSCVPNADAGAGSDGGVACGKATCGAGQKCCSASCGICGSAHGVCPAIACPPEP